MIRRLQRGNHFANIVISTEPEERNPFCSTCAAVGEISRLKVRIYLDDKGKLIQPQPPDADQFLMCYICGLIIPTRHAQFVGKISPIIGVQPVQSPNDIKKTITGNDTRLSSRIKNLKRRQNKHPDSDVQRELDKGNIVTNYQTTMPT